MAWTRGKASGHRIGDIPMEIEGYTGLNGFASPSYREFEGGEECIVVDLVYRIASTRWGNYPYLELQDDGGSVAHFLSIVDLNSCMTA